MASPKTTVIGSYPVFPSRTEVEAYQQALERGAQDEDTVDPYLKTVELSVKDFLSAGIEIPATGQTRDHFTRLFLNPNYVSNIERQDSEILVKGPVKRKTAIRVADVRYAKSFLPPYYMFKEPITDPYTLARSCKLVTSAYTDLKELTFDLARKVVKPEAKDLQKEVDFIQFDGPYYSIDPYRQYIRQVYEELTQSLKKPVVLHVCGDTFGVFKELIKLKVNILSLDFTYNPKLLDEVARRNFDQSIGFGCVNSGAPIVESIEAIKSLLEQGVRKIGEERISLIHPGCGERNLPIEIAYQKNVNMVLARNEVLYGDAQTAQISPLRQDEYDPQGYFMVLVEHQTEQIFLSFNDYNHRPKVRLKSKSGEKLLHTILRMGLASDSQSGRRHLSYLGYELGKAETALRNNLPYRQDRPVVLPHI